VRGHQAQPLLEQEANRLFRTSLQVVGHMGCSGGRALTGGGVAAPPQGSLRETPREGLPDGLCRVLRAYAQYLWKVDDVSIREGRQWRRRYGSRGELRHLSLLLSKTDEASG
jgi:hypothetical protein